MTDAVMSLLASRSSSYKSGRRRAGYSAADAPATATATGVDATTCESSAATDASASASAPAADSTLAPPKPLQPPRRRDTILDELKLRARKISELDTDGIWCMLPSTSPDGFTFKLMGSGKFPLSCPCTMLNHIVHKDFTNDQYHEAGPDGRHVAREENSIFFELDSPYRAIILRSSKEGDKLLNKRYAVFNEDGSLAERKGFEGKRRGELQLIKTFQSQIFEKLLLGSTLEDCCAAVASVTDKWLDVVFNKAVSLPDDEPVELFELIAEIHPMPKTLDEYSGRKLTSVSTVRCSAEFLGEQVIEGKLACRFIVSTKPVGAPVAERAVPVAIFSADLSMGRHFLRKWLEDNTLEEYDLRSILD